MGVGRRLSLVLFGMAIAGTAFVVFRAKPRSTMTFFTPSYDKSIIYTVPTISNKTERTFSLEESREITKCIVEFPKFRSESKFVDRPKMERTRVDSHSYLNSKSRVLEVGGYTGEDAAKLIKKYDPNYIALEPIPRFQKILTERFRLNPKFQMLGIGLGRENKTLYLNIDSDATSIFRTKAASKNTTQEVAHIRELSQVFKELRVLENPIDLLTINCEGCEYELLELLTASKLVNYFKNIQFQFHLDLPGIIDQTSRYCKIMTLLSRTHEPTFQFSFIWQSWKKKKVWRSLYH